jgi:hypothetical protein
MSDLLINNILNTASIDDDLCGQLEDHLRRMGAIDSDTNLCLSSVIEFGVPIDTFEQWY